MNKPTLVESNYLSSRYQSNILLKPEWYGPTKSHKDKWAEGAVELAKKNGAKRVVAMSEGNQGLALAYACKKANIECLVCMDVVVSPVYLELYKQNGASFVIEADEPAQQRAYEKFVEQGYFPLGITHKQRQAGQDLPAVDAYRLTGTEIVGALHDAPDIVSLPVSFADHAEGALREFIDLAQAGKIAKVPRFILARANQRTGSEALSIVTDLTTKYVEDVEARSGGWSVFVTNQEMEKAKAEILSRHGWNIELSSAAGVAALDKLAPDLLKDKTVVAILTALDRK